MFYILFTVILLLSSAVPSYATLPTVLFTYQSRAIPFPQWFDFFTICLAPLIAHIFGGFETPTVLGDRSRTPSWAACLPHLNPISIVWRYYAIVDRRIRALSWDERDMAASNAVFWDGKNARWDGSENIMVKSRAWITKTPEKKHVSLLSASSAVTLVSTLQGIQATFLIIAALIKGSFRFGLGLPNIFIPLQCLGLMRLPAAFWLSSDYGYMDAPAMSRSQEIALTPATKTQGVSVRSLDTSIEQSLSDASVSDRLLPAHCSNGIVWRIFWVLSIMGLLGTAFAANTKIWWGYPPRLPYTATSKLILNSMYLCLTSTGMLVHCTYVLMGRTNTTVIPCIHATWYKLLTIVLIAMAFACILVSSLETRVLRNGYTITTLPEFLCNTTATFCIPVAQGHGDYNI